MAISGISSFQEKMGELKAQRAGAIRLANERQLKVAILGAGPAGLIRAIESVMDNHRTLVIERRADQEGNVNGRSNTVAINHETMPLLQRYGIYQWLLENDRIYPYNEEQRPYISVRLKDIELAMKAVLQELVPGEEIIRYGSSVDQVSEARGQVAIQVSNEWIEDIDILVNAEGSRSSTNQLLHIERREDLEKVPVIAAIFEDTRPSITGVCSFFAYIGETIYQCAVSVYYYAIFFFKFIFQCETIWNQDRTIAGSLILKTPGQNYLGCGFSEAKSEELLALQRKFEALPADSPERLEAEEAFNSMARYWINLSFCSANFFSFLVKCFQCFGCYRGPDIAAEMAGRFPLKSFKMIEIGADRAVIAERRMRDSAYLLCGDALATVDPTTGLGANTAIGTVDYFEDVMKGMKRGRNLNGLLEEYRERCEGRIAVIHAKSKALRAAYRPDAL